jgi:hypothetical protein
MPYGHLSARAPPKLDLFGDRSYPTFNRFTALNQKIVKRAVHNKDSIALKKFHKITFNRKSLFV